MHNITPEMEGTETKPKRTVLLAMDGSEYAKKAFDYYVSDLYREGDRVVLLHSVDHRRGFTYGSVWMPADPEVMAAAYHAEEEAATKVEEKLKEILQNSKIKGEVQRVTGEPGHAIVQAADVIEADLIVTGCRGLGAIRRTVLGSVSDFIIHHAKVPVLVCGHSD